MSFFLLFLVIKPENQFKNLINLAYFPFSLELNSTAYFWSQLFTIRYCSVWHFSVSVLYGTSTFCYRVIFGISLFWHKSFSVMAFFSIWIFLVLVLFRVGSISVLALFGIDHFYCQSLFGFRSF